MYTHWDYVVRGQGRGTHRMVYCPPLRPARKRDGRPCPWKGIGHRQEDKEETEVKRGTAPARTILPLHSKKAIIVMTLLPEWQHRRRQCSRKRPKAWPEQIGWIVPAFFRPSCAATGALSVHLDVEHHPRVEQSWPKLGSKRGGGLRRGTTFVGVYGRLGSTAPRGLVGPQTRSGRGGRLWRVDGLGEELRDVEDR